MVVVSWHSDDIPEDPKPEVAKLEDPKPENSIVSGSTEPQ
jgi:hypothetical protein